MEQRGQGIGVSPGIAIGPALVFETQAPEVPDYAIHDPEAEMARFDRAVDVVRTDLTRLHQRTAAELGEPDAAIIHAHLMLLDDVDVRATINERVRRDLRNAEAVLVQLVKENVAAMKGLDDPMMRERAEDIDDVGDRVLRALLDQHRPDLRKLDAPAVIVAPNLSPTDTAHLDQENTLGLVLDRGSASAHIAILARSMGIPAVMGLEDFSRHVESGTLIAADGATGEVVLEPSAATRADFEQRQTEALLARAEQIARAPRGPCTTRDGQCVPLEANITTPTEAVAARDAGAEGIGLFRTEYLFLSGEVMPSEEEQYEAYATVAETFEDRPVTIRTVDLGGDKFTESLAALREANPQLGWRAIRFCLARPDIFKTQLRAILRASVLGKVQILFPMIGGLDELREARAVLESVKVEMRREGLPFDPAIPVGIMIEIPSAVMLGDELAAECDFFSIGTNDLIQYTLAVDRGNERVAHLYEPAHPAVLKMIRLASQAARKAGIPCAMCGAMAGDPVFTQLLVGLGINALSMPSVLLSEVNQRVHATTLAEAQVLAEAVLRCSDTRQVYERLHAPAVDKHPVKAS